jgi:hypothetical protein
VSTFRPRTVGCASCGADFEVHLLEGLHVSRLPEARRAILDGRFHAFACPRCQATTVIEAPAIYTDFDRHQYVAVEVRGDWRQHRDRHRRVFDQTFTLGPAVARELAHSLTCRLVFGYRALREKLLLWEHGLDDAVLEAMKGEMLGTRRAVARLVAVHEGGHLLCDVRAGASVGWHTFTADEYAIALSERATGLARYPWLQEEWYVDVVGGCGPVAPDRIGGGRKSG